MRTKFTVLSDSETKLNFGEMVIILKRKKVGVYGLGQCITASIQDPKTLKREYLVTCGWTKSDNHSSSGADRALLSGTQNTEEACRKAIVEYLKKIS